MCIPPIFGPKLPLYKIYNDTWMGQNRYFLDIKHRGHQLDRLNMVQGVLDFL